jgi:hypothetical protein
LVPTPADAQDTSHEPQGSGFRVCRPWLPGHDHRLVNAISLLGPQPALPRGSTGWACAGLPKTLGQHNRGHPVHARCAATMSRSGLLPASRMPRAAPARRCAGAPPPAASTRRTAAVHVRLQAVGRRAGVAVSAPAPSWAAGRPCRPCSIQLNAGVHPEEETLSPKLVKKKGPLEPQPSTRVTWTPPAPRAGSRSSKHALPPSPASVQHAPKPRSGPRRPDLWDGCAAAWGCGRQPHALLGLVASDSMSHKRERVLSATPPTEQRRCSPARSLPGAGLFLEHTIDTIGAAAAVRVSGTCPAALDMA